MNMSHCFVLFAAAAFMASDALVAIDLLSAAAEIDLEAWKIARRGNDMVQELWKLGRSELKYLDKVEKNRQDR